MDVPRKFIIKLKKPPTVMPVSSVRKDILVTEASSCYVENNFIDSEHADILLSKCKDLPLIVHPEFKLFGNLCVMHRSMGFFSNKSRGYKFSGTMCASNPLPDFLEELLNIVNAKLSTDFNGILLNLYDGGNDYIGKHSDDEKELSSSGTVAAISLGKERTFRIRTKVKGSTGKIIADVRTKHGQLLIMDGKFQSEYTHEVPAEKGTSGIRVSITFRRHKENLRFPLDPSLKVSPIEASPVGSC